LAHIYLIKFFIKSIFHILYKIDRTSLSLNSTAHQHNRQAASSRDTGLHHSTQSVAS